MAKIIALIMVYNSADTLFKCLMSLDGKVDKILCFDGRWEGFPYPSDHSDDRTDFLVREFSKTSMSIIQYIQLPVIHQYEARTKALEYVKDGDWILILDSDEYIKTWDEVGIRKVMKSNELGFRICYKFPMLGSAIVPPRFWRKTPNVHYSTDHRRIFDNSGEINATHFKPITSIIIDHQEIVDKKRMRLYMEIYEDWLFKWEQNHQVKT